MTTLSYLAKKVGGGDSQSRTAASSQGNMELSVSQSKAVTVQYLLSSLNIQADWQSRNHKGSSDWKLNPKIFSQIVKIRGISQIDLLLPN